MLSALAKFDQFKVQLAEDFAFKQKAPIKAMTQINKVQDPKLKAQLIEKIGPLADQKYAEIAEEYLQQNSPVNAWEAIKRMTFHTQLKEELMQRALPACDQYYIGLVNQAIANKKFDLAKIYANKIQNIELKSSILNNIQAQ